MLKHSNACRSLALSACRFLSHLPRVRETLMFHAMKTETASIRELRTNFRAVKRKIEANGEIIITDNGVPSYVLKPLAKAPKPDAPLPDYYARLLKRQPIPMTAEETKKFWEDE